MKGWFVFLQRNWKIALLGIILRLVPAPFTGHPYDMGIWWITGRLLFEGKSPYTPYDHLGQPVVFGIWMLFSYSVAIHFPFQLKVFALLMKVPLVLTDLFLPYYVLILCRKYSVKIPVSEGKFFAVLFLNPLSVLITGFWAMPDLLSLLLVLLSIDAILEGRLPKASIFLSLSIGIKLYPVVLMVGLMVLAKLRYQSSIKAIAFGSVTSGLFFVISYFPFLVFGWNPEDMTGVLTSQTNRSFGTLSPFHIFILISYVYPSPHFQMVVQFLHQNNWLGFLWIFTSSLLFIFMLFVSQGMELLEDDRISFHFVLDLMIVAYSFWMALASWVSEQNTLAWFTLVYVRSLLDDDNTVLILSLFSSFSVIGFAIYNLPFFKFFYMSLAPIVVFELNLNLNRNRNLFLALFGSAFYVTMMFISVKHCRNVRSYVTYWKKVF